MIIRDSRSPRGRDEGPVNFLECSQMPLLDGGSRGTLDGQHNFNGMLKKRPKSAPVHRDVISPSVPEPSPSGSWAGALPESEPDGPDAQPYPAS